MTRLALATMFAALVLPFLAGPGSAADVKVTTSHGLTLGAELKYPPGFTQLDYVNPDAPKGGTLWRYDVGTFDSFNPYIIKGTPVTFGLFESLMDSPYDDIDSEYGLIAETVEVPEDLSYVIYNLRPEARFHDGSPITADDVIFSLNILKKEGAPVFRFYYANIARAVKLGPRRVRFDFTGPRNRELPQITGQLPVLSKAYWEKHEFDKTTLDPPMGSGPYRIAKFEPGRYVVFERVKDYWGKDLPLNKGRYNFDRIRVDFYRDETVALEAFKAGQYDYRVETSAKNWATAYDFAAKREGLVATVELPNTRPTGMQAFVFNIRRPLFQDEVLRTALAYGFDFEWSNKHLFYGQYTRTKSYFSNSELAARMPPSPAEVALLEPFRGKVPDEVFTKVYEPPKTDGSGNIRHNLRIAARMLSAAGYEVKNGKLISPRTGAPVTFEILLAQPAMERVVTPMLRNFARLGVSARIRTVDVAQYINRLRDYDFDMIVGSFPQSDSPGNEQREYWSSAAADRPGSRNLIGIKDPVVDALIDRIIAAPTRTKLVTAVRSLDRVLLWHHYVIPQFHSRIDRVAYWKKFGLPPKHPSYAPDFMSWWIDPAKEAVLKARGYEQ